jgi:hypothetical protein
VVSISTDKVCNRPVKWAEGKELALVNNTLYQVDTAEIAQNTLAQLQQVDGRWTHSPHSAQNEETLQQLFALYAQVYADKMKARSFIDFQEYYQHDFILKDAQGQIMAFILGKDTLFGIKLNLMGTNGAVQTKMLLFESILALGKVAGIYGQVSSKVRQMVWQTCDKILLQKLSGEAIQLPFQIVNPKLAPYLLDDELALDSDSLHVIVRDDRLGKIQLIKTLVIGIPLLPDNIVQVCDGAVFLDADFLFKQRYTYLTSK